MAYNRGKANAGVQVKSHQFQNLIPNISGNGRLRAPQIGAYEAVAEHDFTKVDGREIGIVLPVGCGKSGLIAIAPFALKSRRTLIVAPNLNIADQLLRDLSPNDLKFFYGTRGVLLSPPYPEPAEIRGASSNIGDLEDADVVITNIQQLQRANNKWLSSLPADFFDLIEFDEAHHNVAESWETVRQKFPAARIINVSATPTRADGRRMSGEIIYSYPVSKAVANGFVKRINGHRLNPKSLRYVRQEGGAEVTVELDEVRRLGETDAKFRRSIVSSEETLSTIAEASVRKLQELQQKTGEKRLKIIASALNMDHCKQVVAKYRALGLKADFVHSDLGKANDKVYAKLENHELNVIVQVRKLGEGFDHPFLTVAAVFSIFSNLGPFMQFVGRIMRIIPGVDPFDAVNAGVVVFHVGGNITGVWNDFQEFAEADQQFFANLVDEELVESEEGTGSREGGGSDAGPLPVITGQGEIQLEGLTLLSANPEVAKMITALADLGVNTGEQFDQLKRMTPTKQEARKAKRLQLDEQVKTRVGRILAQHSVQHAGHELDKSYRRDNFQVIKGAIDKRVNAMAPSGAKRRAEFTNADLDFLLKELSTISAEVEAELFRG